MNPLLVQIIIGASALALGFVIGLSTAGKRIARFRAAAQEQADGLEEQLAVKKLRIRELEAKLEKISPRGPSPADIPPTLQEVLAAARNQPPARLASRMDRTTDSAPPRV